MSAIQSMGSSLNYGPILGPHYSTAPLFKKRTPEREPNLENYPCGPHTLVCVC